MLDSPRAQAYDGSRFHRAYTTSDSVPTPLLWHWTPWEQVLQSLRHPAVSQGNQSRGRNWQEAMKRRVFFKCLGVAGAICFLRSVTLGPSSQASSVNGREELHSPYGVAIAAGGELVVTDPSRYRIVRFDSDLVFVGAFGKPGSAPGKLNYPTGIAVDSNGDRYVVDTNNCRVQVFNSRFQHVRSIGSIGSIGGKFSTPQGVHVDHHGRMLVADTRNHRIQVFADGQLDAVIGSLGDGDDQFRLPVSAVVTPDEEIAVLDSKHGLVKIFGKDCQFRRAFGGVGDAPGELNAPQGMALDGQHHLWIADTRNHRLQEFDLHGAHLSVVGQKGSEAGEFQSPTGVAFSKDKLYVADQGNGRIQVLEYPSEA